MAFDFNTQHPTMPDLMGFSEFELAEHKFQGWQPRNDRAPREWVLEVSKEGTVIRTERVQMYHPNRWGPDIEDLHRLNAKVEEVIKEMGLE